MTYRSNGIVLHSPVVAPTGDVRREWYIVTDPLHGYRVSRAKAEEYIDREGLVEALDCEDGTVWDTPDRAFQQRYRGFVKEHFIQFMHYWQQ